MSSKLVNKTAKEKRALTLYTKKRVAGMKKTQMINGITLEQRDVKCLLQKERLNDNVINAYLSKLIVASADFYVFNTFFYQKFVQCGHGGVSKWTKRCDLFSYKSIFVPIYVNQNHWTLAVINNQLKRLDYYDSLGNGNAQCIDNLFQYMMDEWRAKKASEFDIDGWQSYEPGLLVPQQNNTYDCGVFMCQFVRAIVEGFDLSLIQQCDINYYRNLMINDIFPAG